MTTSSSLKNESNNSNTVIQTLTYDKIKDQNLNIMTNMIYKQFIELAEEPMLKHSQRDILDTLTNKNVVLVLLLDNNKMIGYVLSYIEHLEDGRRILFISYIYIAPKYRNRGYGDRLMTHVEKYASKHDCDGVMLIYDTDDQKLVHFYEKRGYMQDLQLRRYHRHDVFYKYI